MTPGVTCTGTDALRCRRAHSRRPSSVSHSKASGNAKNAQRQAMNANGSGRRASPVIATSAAGANSFEWPHVAAQHDRDCCVAMLLAMTDACCIALLQPSCRGRRLDVACGTGPFAFIACLFAFFALPRAPTSQPCRAVDIRHCKTSDTGTRRLHLDVAHELRLAGTGRQQECQVGAGRDIARAHLHVLRHQVVA